MKILNKLATIFLVMVITFSLLCVTACKKEEDTTYYVYKSVEMEADFEIQYNSEYKDIAKDIESSVNADLILQAQAQNEFCAQSVAKLTEKQLTWLAGEDMLEFSIRVSKNDKKYITEVDDQMVDKLEYMLANYNATINGMTFYVEKEEKSLELCVEVSATQTILEGVNLFAEYDFEYKFTKIAKPEEFNESSSKLATYNYKTITLNAVAEIVNAGQLQEPLTLKGEIETLASSNLADVIAFYNNTYKNAKITVYEDKVVFGNAGIRSTYEISEIDENEIELTNLNKGIIKNIKEVLQDRKIKGSNITINDYDAKVVENGKNGLFVVEFETSISVAFESKIVQVNLDLEFAIAIQK